MPTRGRDSEAELLERLDPTEVRISNMEARASGGDIAVRFDIAWDDSWRYGQETDGYAVVWPAVAIPVLAAIPIVTLLADEENRRAGAATIRGRGSRRGG